jgi:hypothetical protein
MPRVVLLTLLMISLAAHPASAQQNEIRVDASLSSDTITEEDILQLIVSITASSSLSDIDVQLPPLRDFDKIGENTSSQFSQFNLEVRSVLSYIYNLRPKSRGTFTIPPVTVKVAGRTFTTQPLQVTVTPGRSGDEIILRQSIDRDNVYIGQQITLTTELLFRVNVLGYDVIEEPAPEGFVVQRDETLKQVTLEEIEFNGQSYYRAVLGRQFLFPLAPGSKEIKPPSFQVEYRPTGFGMGTKLARRTAEPLSVNVKPLPSLGRPDGFDGAVGDYTLEWSVSDTACRVNEPLTLSVELNGKGDIERAPDAKPSLPAGLELINSRSEQNAAVRDNRWGGRKRWEFILIPNRAGQATLGPLNYPFFDPETGRYNIASTAPIQLTIAPPAQVASSAPSAPSEAETSEWDIRYIKTPSAPLTVQGRPFYQSPLFWVVVLTPLFANALIFAGTKLLRRGRAREPQWRRRKALSSAIKNLSRAGAKSDPAAVGAALMTYFAEKLDIRDRALSLADVRAALVHRDLHEHPLFVELSGIMEACDSARYAPIPQTSRGIKELAADAARALAALDELL